MSLLYWTGDNVSSYVMYLYKKRTYWKHRGIIIRSWQLDAWRKNLQCFRWQGSRGYVKQCHLCWYPPTAHSKHFNFLERVSYTKSCICPPGEVRRILQFTAGWRKYNCCEDVRKMSLLYFLSHLRCMSFSKLWFRRLYIVLKITLTGFYSVWLSCFMSFYVTSISLLSWLIVCYLTLLHCTVLYCTVLYCTVLYCTVLYCTVLYCTALCYNTILCHIIRCSVHEGWHHVMTLLFF